MCMCVHKCIHLKACIPVYAGACVYKYVYQYLDKCLFRYSCGACVCVERHVSECPDLCMRLHGCTCKRGFAYPCTARLVWAKRWMHVCCTVGGSRASVAHIPSNLGLGPQKW